MLFNNATDWNLMHDEVGVKKHNKQTKMPPRASYN